MSPVLIISVIVAYFFVLLGISYFTSRKADNESFFVGNRKSPWFVVAFGMIGASLSGVTFISVPGWVENQGFGYMQIVFGYFVGYMIISFVLIPLYYRLKLTSIYTYLRDRFGVWSYKTGASFFLLSRILGAAFRLYLVAIVLQRFVFDAWGVPFELTVFLSIALIWIYTFKGGIKTIIWTDTLQTLFMLLAVGISVVLIAGDLDLAVSDIAGAISESEYGGIFQFDDPKAANYFVKQFLAGIFIAVCMTGLDQDMMQKNLSCKSTKSAQLNMVSFSAVLVVVNLVFLALGALLFMYANAKGIEVPLGSGGDPSTDLLYPEIALNGGLGVTVGIVFLLGLVAAAYSSADSALTALTTSVCLDLLETDKKPENEQKRTRMVVHVVMSLVLLVTIVIFKYTGDQSVISKLLKYAGYTYGPLLGLYSFGILTRLRIRDHLVLVVCLTAILITAAVDYWGPELLNGFKFGFEIILVNGFLTFIGLLILSVGLDPLPASRPEKPNVVR